MFYPDLSIMKRNNSIFNQHYEFQCKDFGDPFDGKPIDPDIIQFKNPDFGFNNPLIFEEEQ